MTSDPILPENIVYDRVGEWPDDPDDLECVHDYLLWLLDETEREGLDDDEEEDVYQAALNDFVLLNTALFGEHEQVPFSGSLAGWQPVKDGDPRAVALFERHYSADTAGRRRRGAKLFVGPGFKLVLMTPACDALIAWRLNRFRDDGQYGAECTVFRNESGELSSWLLLEAEEFVLRKWPMVTRLYTYVDKSKVKSSNPGFCFIKAGWRKAGRSGKGLRRLVKTVRPPALYVSWS